MLRHANDLQVNAEHALKGLAICEATVFLKLKLIRIKSFRIRVQIRAG